MPADRKVPAPSNTPGGGISGTTFMEDVLAEVQALYRYVQIPLYDVAGTNTITAKCNVPLDARAAGNKFTLTPVAGNTGAATLEIDLRGPLPIKDRTGAALAAGRLVTGRSEVLEDFGTEYRLLLDPPLSASATQRSIIAYQQPSGTDGGSTTTGWNKYPLNTIIRNDIAGLTFNAGTNQITLSTGTYKRVRAVGFNYTAQASSLHLWNVSDNVEVAGFARVVGRDYSAPEINGQFSIGATKVFELRLYTAGGQSGIGFGQAVGIASPSAIPEQYGFIEFEVAP